ncbi:MAG: ornithine--oxo-acid transaminase [Flaviflexus sp.]|nr:ornithine--oxo-acid transaminase [Flaviflexus sp.]
MTLTPNYNPLPVTLREGHGTTVTDVEGRDYLDFLAGYSAVNFGHSHPRLVEAVAEQAKRLTLVSRAFDHDLLMPFANALTELTQTEMMLPMNTGAEAVESAIKAARKWAYDVKGIEPYRAEIIAAEGSFHGRTTTIVSFSSDPDAKDGFGPYTPGFITCPYGDAGAIENAITENTAAILVEPIQGEAGVLIPPEDYLPRLRELADQHNVLLIVDEVQSGLGRTGYLLDQWRVGVKADLTTLGKALGGGVYPVSAVVGRADVLGCLTAGTHGSTFGGNPVACRIGLEVVELLKGDYLERATKLAPRLRERLEAMVEQNLLSGVRTVGLWAGVDVHPDLGLTGREVCERMLQCGVLAKDTHGASLRLAPPLVVTEEELERGLDGLEAALKGDLPS